MLNLTNRTISANFTRLNLGTRSLADNASVNTVDSILRARHAHAYRFGDSMRLGDKKPMKGLSILDRGSHPISLTPMSPRDLFSTLLVEASPPRLEVVIYDRPECVRGQYQPQEQMQLQVQRGWPRPQTPAWCSPGARPATGG